MTDWAEMKSRCLRCSQGYALPSFFRWAFDADLTVIGTIHPKEARQWQAEQGLAWWHVGMGGDPEQARRAAWYCETMGSPSPWYLTRLFPYVEGRPVVLSQWWEANSESSPASRVSGFLKLIDDVRDLDAQYTARFPEPLEEI